MGKSKKSKEDLEYAEWFGLNLTNILNKNGIFAKDIADQLGIDKSIVSRWCNGKMVPNAVNTVRIANILGVPPTALTLKSNTRLGKNLARIANENKEIDDIFLDKYVNLSDENKQRLIDLIDVLF